MSPPNVISLVPPADSISDCLETLRAAIAAKDKTIAALMKRVHSTQSGHASGFELFRASAFLQRRLESQNQDLERTRAQLAASVAAHEQESARRAQLERDLAEASRIEALGRLAGGIAHEINTPAQYVGDNLRFLQESLARLLPVLLRAHADPSGLGAPDLQQLDACNDLDFLREEMPKAIAQSLEGMDHISNIVRSMKELCHPGGGNKVPVDLNRALQTAATVAKPELKYRAQVVQELEPNLPRTLGYASELGQVFLNLIVNASHAIEDAGICKDGNLGVIRLRTYSESDCVVAEVEDNGCGMPDNVKAKIFEPFFTTKEVGRGTGQGLAIARSVICQTHGGSISVESTLGNGSKFIIRLPITHEPSGAT